MQEILLILVLLLAIAWLVVRIRGKKHSAEKQTEVASPKNSAYHAVSIKYSENSCDAAKAMTGRRFLASAAPKLPLPECDLNDCQCKFAHHADRRSEGERRSPFTSGFRGGTGTFAQERRDRPDRRKNTDLDSDWK